MPIDDSVKGTRLPSVTMTLEAGRLASFAGATGQPDPVYRDPLAARNAGLPGLPVPPTFLFAIELEQPDPFAWLTGLGVDLRWVLHGEQAFTYHAMAYSGNTLVASPQIADVYRKKGGALQFVVKRTAVTHVDGSPVADLDSVIVVREPEVTS
ncbi:MaoC family dehydratase N-terminal domain-containing protein [Amycolatopsis jiangsuensis]|uniref:Acyl dehydratase n=1 Tax=Amycolatopsis jiangsuensis TaxID=1181879 RepID=A0A840IT00_9PSEU|nr:MaoC family dehydratase N-terminal domain-containing protein [Amycolatopsis jiangsuensis]MBB4685751.1 acyl dehydratase [Amycolatopsis jiangsuensis]